MKLTPVSDDVFRTVLPPLRHMNAYLVDTAPATCAALDWVDGRNVAWFDSHGLHWFFRTP
jgi:hypothetical protein